MSILAIWQQLRCTTPAHVRRHPLRYALSVLSIAAAVAMFVSMRITQTSILAAFRGNLDALAGAADYRVSANGRANFHTLTALERIDGVKAAPLIAASAVLTEQRRAVLVLGIDPLREARLRPLKLTQQIEVDLPTLILRPDSVVIPKRLAEMHNWRIGGEITLTGPVGPRRFRIAGLLHAEGPAAALDGQMVFMNLPAAQRFFDRGDSFDRIDLALAPPATLEAIRAAVGPDAEITPARTGDQAFEYIYIQFQTILVCVSILASVIGLFIVYNTLSLSVIQRAKHIGTLRALGARRHEILLVFTGEAALLGLVASLLGLVGGRAVADEALRHTAQTLTLMMDLGRIDLVVPSDVWLLAPLVGVIAAVAGAIVPARSAAMLPPVAAMRPGQVEQSLRTQAGLWMLIGVALMALCIVIVWHPRTDWRWSVSGVAAGLVGLALTGPQLLIWATPWVRRLAERFSSVPAHLALDNLVKFPSRTSLTVFALGGSLSLVVSITSLVDSVQRDIENWVNEVFVFDLMMQTNDPKSSAYPSGTFPGELVAQVRADSQCRDAYGVRILRLPLNQDDILLIAYEPEVWQRIRAETGTTPDAQEDIRHAEALKSGRIGISHNLARLFRLKVGDRMEIPTPAGSRTFEIDAIRRDYSWFRGCIFMDLEHYRSKWGDTSLSYLDVRVRPDEDIEAYRAALTDRFADKYGLFVYRTSQLREHTARYTSEWFALANVQLLLAVIIGGVGVTNTLLVSLLTQSRQIGLLRAIGATTGHIQRMLAGEAFVLGLLGGAAGCAMGLLTVKFLVAPMAIKATGYDLNIIAPYGAMAAAFVAAVIIALGAALLPLRAARRIDVIQAIGYE